MPTIEEVKRILSSLSFAGSARIPILPHLEVELQAAEQGRITMLAAVFQGMTYIPKAVRLCLKTRGPCEGLELKAALLVDEANFKVNFIYQCEVEKLTEQQFADVLEEFSWQAEEWHNYIEQHGEGDLVPIHVKQT